MRRDKLAPRLVICGIGQYGVVIARLAVKKGWPIVAAFNRAGAKVGQDLGRVIGLEQDIVGALPETLPRIYNHANVELRDESVERMLAWKAENAMLESRIRCKAYYCFGITTFSFECDDSINYRAIHAATVGRDHNIETRQLHFVAR